MKLSNYNFDVLINENYVIVLNTLENVYIQLEKKQFEILCNDLDLFLKENPKESEILISNGFIISNTKNEILKAKENYLKKCYNTSVYNATIIPTLQCNLKCDYCFIEQNNEHMDLNTINATTDFLNDIINTEAAYLKHFNVKWFGGEPLLYPETIKVISDSLIENCNKKNITYHAMLYSNLCLVDDRTIDILIKSKIKRINTTLDGYGEKNDVRRKAKNGKSSFNTIIDNIKKLKKIFYINIQINIDKRNKKDVYYLLEYLINEKIVDGKYVTVGFNLVNDNHNISDKTSLLSYDDSDGMIYINRYYKQLGKLATHNLPTPALNCFAVAKNSVVIDPKGNLYKCFKDTKTNIPYGNLFETKDNWDDLQFQGLLHDPFGNLKCVSCSVFPLCYGGCQNFGNGEQICSLKFILEHKIRRYFNNYDEVIK